MRYSPTAGGTNTTQKYLTFSNLFFTLNPFQNFTFKRLTAVVCKHLHHDSHKQIDLLTLHLVDCTVCGMNRKHKNIVFHSHAKETWQSHLLRVEISRGCEVEYLTPLSTAIAFSSLLSSIITLYCRYSNRPSRVYLDKVTIQNNLTFSVRVYTLLLYSWYWLKTSYRIISSSTP